MLKISVFNGNILSYNGSFIAFDDSAPSPTYDADAEAYFARMTTQPSTGFKDRVDTFIRAQKTSGLWAKKKVVVILQGETQQGSLLNMIGNANNPTFMNSPTWSTDGVTCTYTGEIVTNFNPSTDGGIIFTQNNARCMIYIKTSTFNGGADILSSTINPSISLSVFSGEDRDAIIFTVNNDQASLDYNYYGNIGISEIQRESSSIMKYTNYYDGNTFTSNKISTGLPNTNLRIGVTTLRQYGFYEFGSVLTPSEATDNYNQIKTLLQIP